MRTSIEARNEYERLLIQLHNAMSKNDEQLAEQIRDLMESPWYDMDGNDRKLTDEAGEDLYILNGRRFRNCSLPRETDEILKFRLWRAFELKNWIDALTCCRKLRTIEPHHIEIMGKCHQNLGFNAMAELFLKSNSQEIVNLIEVTRIIES